MSGPGVTPSREVMWNVGSPGESLLMYAALAAAVTVAAYGCYRRAALWAGGRPAPAHTGDVAGRLADLTGRAHLQKDTVRDRSAGLFHSLIYAGFLVLLFTTTMVFLDHDLGLRIYRGDFYLAVTVLSDVFGLALLVGVAMAYHRRYVTAPDRLHSGRGDALLLHTLALLVIQGFLLEALRIKVTGDPWARYSPVGAAVAGLFWPVSDGVAVRLHYVTWWWHTLTVFAAIALVPYTKFFHILSSPANLYAARSGRPRGALSPVGDIARMMEGDEEFTVGTGTLLDYSWKQRLDLDACTSCGRCQDVCPAYESGKPLSPKWLVLDTRHHMIGVHASGALASPGPTSPLLERLDKGLLENMTLGRAGLVREDDGSLRHADPSRRAANGEVANAVRHPGASPETLIAGGVMDPDVFWSCTTCGACVEACPVGIDHVDHIVGSRRHMTLMRGEVPDDARQTLSAIESTGNPYGPAAARMEWAAGLDVPVIGPGDSVDYLYWVGCVSAYDVRKQKIARSLVALLRHAGVSFGVLGNAERCTGDPARRLGEENLFQTLAKANLELLRSVRFEKLVANCPHCFNTIRNEYPEFGNLGEGRSPEIIHHSVLLDRLVSEGKIVPGVTDRAVTFHDPCYLGRYNDEYDAPRNVLVSIGGSAPKEMDRSREKAMCCGAGGGHFWMDMKKGRRVNSVRLSHAEATGRDRVATACPFCLQMLEDGTKLNGREDMDVKDVAEILADSVGVAR